MNKKNIFSLNGSFCRLFEGLCSILDVPILLEHTRTFNVSKGDPLTVTIQVYAFPAVQRTGIVINIGDRIMSNSDNITVNLKNGTGFVSFHNRNITSDIQTLSVVISATQEEHFHNCTVKFTNAVGTTTAHFEISPQGSLIVCVGFVEMLLMLCSSNRHTYY